MNTFKKTSIFLAVFFTAIFFSQCTLQEDIAKVTDAAKDLRILIGTPEFKAMTHFVIKDAKTDEYITAEATIFVTGKDAALIYNNIGERQTEYKSALGMLDLVVDPHKLDSNSIKTKPILFDVTVVVPGYNTVTQRVSLSEIGLKFVTVKLINFDNPPTGVIVSQNQNFGTTGSTGALTQTSTQSLNSGSFIVELPKGAILKDASGKPLSGKVESQIIYFDPTKKEALEATPGGLFVTAKMPNGNYEDVYFNSAGMFQIFLTVGGQRVDQIENGEIKIISELDPTLINPKTAKAYVENDEIKLWSFENGEWVYKKTALVVKISQQSILEKASNSNSQIRSVNHSGLGSLIGFYTTAPYMLGGGPGGGGSGFGVGSGGSGGGGEAFMTGNETRQCSNSPTIKWKGNTNKSASVRMNISIGDGPLDFETTNASSEGSYQLSRRTSGVGIIRFQLIHPGFIFSPSELTIPDYCSSQSYDVVITQKDIITVKADLTLKTKSNVYDAKPNGTINLKKVGLTDWVVYPVKDGKCNLYVQQNADYDISATYGKDTVVGKLRVNTVGAKLQVVYTPITTGGNGTPVTLPAVDKNADNSVDVKYDITGVTLTE